MSMCRLLLIVVIILDVLTANIWAQNVPAAVAVPQNSPAPFALTPKMEPPNNYLPLPQVPPIPYYPQIKLPVGVYSTSSTQSPLGDQQLQGVMPAGDVVGINWKKIAERLNLPNFFKDLDFKPVFNIPNENSANTGNLGSQGNLGGLGNIGNPANLGYPFNRVQELSVKVVFYVRNFDASTDLQVTYDAGPNGYEVSYKIVPSFPVGGFGGGGSFGGGGGYSPPAISPTGLKSASG